MPKTRITGNDGNVNVHELNRFDETFGDIGRAVSVWHLFVENEFARLALIAEAEMWGVNQGTLNNRDVLDFDRFKRWSLLAGARLTIDTDIGSAFSGVPIRQGFLSARSLLEL